MGFSDISLEDSDTASDLLWSVKKSPQLAISIMNEAIDVDNGRWNTPGYVNAGLVLAESGIDFSGLIGYDELLHRVSDLITEVLDVLATEPNDAITIQLQNLMDKLQLLKERSETYR
jgi:hypothetical protein